MNKKTAPDISNLLKASEEKYRTFFNNSMDAILITSQDGRIHSANIAACKMLGWEEEDLIRLGRDGIVEKSLQLESALSIRRETGKFFGEIWFIRKDGCRFPVEISSSVFSSDGTELTAIIARDITERKKIEQALKLSEERLRIDIFELKRMEDELLSSKKILENLNQHLLEVRESERSEIALNLHDDLGQRLTAIDLDVAWLKSRVGVQTPRVTKKFNDVTRMINEAIDSIKELSSFLRPSILYDLGIVTAFEWQLRSMEKLSKIKCNFNYSPIDSMIDDRISLILYRVLQESLTNAIRHSGASVVNVELCIKNEKVLLTIKDNGKGIEDEESNSLTSMGISGIKERVASVSGKVVIKGKKDHGTTVSVLIPLVYNLKV
jgi:PAS domain S-box-containing protein